MYVWQGTGGEQKAGGGEKDEGGEVKEIPCGHSRY